jgi:phosphoribosylanthranilate isomerase
VPPFVTLVALFVNPERRVVDQVLERLPIGMLQFHGEESAAFCAGFNMPYLKAFRVRPDTDLTREVAAYSSASGLLLDTYRAGVPGGTGEAFDWASVPPRLPRPVVLAGGLQAGNVGEAIARVWPAAVDVSGGVESAPGEKDARMMSRFMQAVRAADEERNGDAVR